MKRIGIDIGGTKINIGIVDEAGRLISSKKIAVSEIVSLTDDVISVLDELCTEGKIDFSELASCGIGVPGTVSDDGKRLLKAPNISILSEDVAEDFEKTLGLPTSLVQDSRAAAYAEAVCGGGVGKKTVVCITLGTGIGTGIVIDGKIYNGALGSAGEMGHIPVVENGRACGCGKFGCLEKYAAGGGLDLTAAELLGEGNTAKELFLSAERGNADAILAIEQAADMLGAAVVSIINLISPDCILFSGGLSARADYVERIIAYASVRCYSTGRIPEMKRAELSENAPLIGAALIPSATRKKSPELSASIMCADALKLGAALDEIAASGIEYIHADIMDNHFVPNLMLPMELLNRLHAYSELPFDFHIMAENPTTVIEKLDLRAGDYVSVHYESTNHLARALDAVTKKGARAAVAINPATPIEHITEVLPMVDMVLLMTVNPGFAGQKIVPTSFDKIKRMREMLDRLGYENIKIEVDGNCSFENVPKMYDAGAEIFVVGSSSVFKKDLTVAEGARMLRDMIKN